VLLAADGPRVIDFGISRVGEGAAVTAAGAVFGTPSYMSPEQAEGKPGDRASDVFSLGSVMTYAATGAPPFSEGSAASVLYQVVHTEPALEGLVPWLRELVVKCLAKDPAARPTPRALAAALARGGRETGPLAMSFWPKSVADLIAAYQPRLEAQATERAPTDDGEATTYGLSAAEISAAAGGPHGYPSPQGYPGAQGALASRASETGFTAFQQPFTPGAWSDPPGTGTEGNGSRQPEQAAWQSPRLQPPVPESVRNAVRLMYAGASYALIYSICAVLIIQGAGNPFASINLKSEVVAALSCVIQVPLWLWMAWACRRGKNWARITSTVFFGVSTVVALIVLLRYRHYAAGIIGTVLIAVTWLIAGGSVLLLWQRRSSSFFKTPRPAQPAGSTGATDRAAHRSSLAFFNG